DGDREVADLDGVTVVEAAAVEAVLPVRSAFAGEVDGGSGRLCQLPGAGEVVGVNVGLGHMRDAHAVGFGHVEVDLDVAAGVDDDGVVRLLTADEVAGLGEVFVVDAFEKHGVSFLSGLTAVEGRRQGKSPTVRGIRHGP